MLWSLTEIFSGFFLTGIPTTPPTPTPPSPPCGDFVQVNPNALEPIELDLNYQNNQRCFWTFNIAPGFEQVSSWNCLDPLPGVLPAFSNLNAENQTVSEDFLPQWKVGTYSVLFCPQCRQKSH